MPPCRLMAWRVQLCGCGGGVRDEDGGAAGGDG